MTDTKILLDTIKLQDLFIQAIYDIKHKDYYIAMEKLDYAYNLFDKLIQEVHPLSEIRELIINLRDKIEYNMKHIQCFIQEPSNIDNIVMYDKEIMEEINNDYPVTVPYEFTCFDPIYHKINQLFTYYNKVKLD